MHRFRFLVLAVVCSIAGLQAADLPVNDLPQRNSEPATVRTTVDTTALDTTDNDTLTVQKAPDTSKGAIAHAKNAGDSAAIADTAYTFWLHPFWGIGAGMTIGSFPLFDAWQSSVPMGLGLFATDTALGSHVVAGSLGDSVVHDTSVFRLSSIEAPAPYTICFPITLSRYLFTDSIQFLAIDASFLLVYKSLKVEERMTNNSDTTTLFRQTVNQSIGLYSGSIGVRYSHAIPSRYFTVAGVDRASLTVGLSAIPLTYLKSSFARKVLSGQLADSLSPRLAAASTSFTRSWSYSGAGLSWLFGISGLTKFSPVKGLEGGLYYSGSWIYFPNLSERILDYSQSGGKAGYSTICHRLAIVFSLLRGSEKKSAAP